MTDHRLDPKFIAGVELIGRTGAKDFRVGYSDEADGDPVVWYAVATWPARTAGGYAVRGTQRAEAAGGLDPIRAVLRLCEQLIDGGRCEHCGRSTIFDDNPTGSAFDDLLEAMGCVYAWDPELATFRRGCEGDAP